MTDALKRNANLVEALGSALREGGHALGTVPGLIKRVLVEESWREFTTQRGEHVEYSRFAEFVSTPPLRGLGASPEVVRDLIVKDGEALSLFDAAIELRQGERTDLSHNIREVKRQGTSKDQALRKLRKDAPELHADVLAKKLTAHAAMVRAGFRHPTATVRTDSPEHVAAALRRLMSAEDVELVAKLLRGET